MSITPEYERADTIHCGEIVARRLSLHSAVPAQAIARLDRLLGRPVDFPQAALIGAAGDEADLVTVMRDGFACRMSMLPDGRRQIHSLLLPGDTADAETPLLGLRTDNIEALTRCSVWLVPKARLTGLLQGQPALAEAFAREAAIAAQVAREWVVNIGRKDATERLAHFICELHARMDAMGLVEKRVLPFPLTQVELADAQGMSAVHVNRVLQDLRRRGLIRCGKGHVEILDLQALQSIGLFDPGYLHLGRPVCGSEI